MLTPKATTARTIVVIVDSVSRVSGYRIAIDSSRSGSRCAISRDDSVLRRDRSVVAISETIL